jgi:hypothetical protein
MKVLSALMLFIALSGAAWAQPNPATVKRPQTVPVFAFQTLDGQAFTQGNLSAKPGWATVVVFFDPGCEHCQQQAEWIKAELPKFKSVQFVWASTMPAKTIQDFEQKYFPQAGRPQTVAVHFVRDGKYAFDNYFGYSTVPTLLVYGRDGKFRKVFTNEIAADEILKAIQ